jgi:hypothetical protein
MVKIVIYTTQEVVDARKKGLRVAGRLYTEKASEEHDEITVFLPYNRKPKKPTKTLYRTANGRLFQTCKLNKVSISSKRSVGYSRGAGYMLGEMQEMAQYMMSLALKGGDDVEN